LGLEGDREAVHSGKLTFAAMGASMFRYIFGGAGALLLIGAGIFFWMSRAQQESLIPSAPKGAAVASASGEAEDEEGGDANAPPPPDERSREQKRFDRADKDRNGRILLAEMLEPRRKPFAKLDTNGDGRLSFEEWTVKTSEKFAEADKDKDGALVPAEFATTKPKRAAKPKCAC
jgi:hypothetical protein